jgi:O-antigen/teichoic acid export membrane protein
VTTGSNSSGSARRDLGALIGRSGIYAFSDILKQAINFLLLPLYTAYLSTDDYGILSIALAASAVLEVFYGFGLRGAVGRLYFDQQDEAQVRDFLGTLALFLAVAGIALTILLLAVGPFVWPLDDVPFSPHIVLVLIAVLLNSLGLSLVLPLYYVRGQAGRYAAFSLLSFAVVTAATLLFVVALGQGAEGALWGRVLGGAIMLVPALMILARHSHFGLRWPILSPALAFSLPLVPHLISQWVLNFSDRLILGALVSLDDVGIYAVGYQFGLAVSIVITAINNAWTPWYFRAHTEGRRDHIPAFVTYYVIVTAGLALGAALFAREAVGLMTAEAYHAAWRIVPIVALGYFLNGLAARFLDVLLLQKRTGVIPITTVAAGAANVAFNLLAIPEIGMIGAAYGTLFGYAVRVLLTGYYAAQTGPPPVEWRRVLAISGLAGLCAVPGVILSSGSWGLDLLAKGGLFALYGLAVLGVLTHAERRSAARLAASLRRRLSRI